MKRLAALVLVLVCMCSFAHAETWIPEDVTETITEWFEEETLITTVGTAVSDAKIDIATLVFSVESTGETVAEANQQVMANISTITDVLLAQGVEEDQIWHRRYDVEPNVVYHNTKYTDDKVIDGYHVEIVLCVRLTDLNLVGVVLDAAMVSGAAAAHELEFERSSALAVYENALTLAAQQAMEKAQKLAEGCGMQLEKLVSVKELSSVEDSEAMVEITYSAR